MLPAMTGPAAKASVRVFGTVFFDVVFSDLPSPPRPGTEVRTGRLGLSPGGSANIAVALARLGLDARLSAPFAGDAFGYFLWGSLSHEGVDLSSSTRFPAWTTPVTVSLAYRKERSLVTYEEAAPQDAAQLLAKSLEENVSLVGESENGGTLGAGQVEGGGGEDAPRRTERALVADACYLSLTGAERAWLEKARDRFGLVFADVGWDEAERWGTDVVEELSLVDAFLPNAAEAMAYSRTETPLAAAEALARHVPLAVVKCGAEGAVAAGRGLEEPISVGALPVEAVDTTGAGDVFDAAFIYGSLAGWPVRRRLQFANLCAGESVRYTGGSFSAPCWRDLGAWWLRQHDPETKEAYAFLPELLETCRPGRTCQRPCASLPWHTG